MKYVPDRRRDERIRSAAVAMAAILPLEIDVLHKRELLGVCLWKVTEADGKWNVRYRSEGARGVVGNRDLCHEHVYPRKYLIKCLLDGEPVDSVISKAIACIVTRSEHKLLDDVSESAVGWKRYEQAGIRVWNLERSCWMELQLVLESERTP